MNRRQLLKAIPAVSTPFVFGGCAQLKQYADENNTVLKIAVSEAVSARIRNDDDPEDRAEKILQYALGIKDLLDGERLTTFDELQSVLVAELPDYLTPTSRIAAEELIVFLVSKAREKVIEQVGEVSAGDMQFTANYFLDVVIETAEFYAAQ